MTDSETPPKYVDHSCRIHVVHRADQYPAKVSGKVGPAGEVNVTSVLLLPDDSKHSKEILESLSETQVQELAQQLLGSYRAHLATTTPDALGDRPESENVDPPEGETFDPAELPKDHAEGADLNEGNTATT